MDTYRNYELIFYMAGGELITAGVFLALASFFCIKQKKSKDSPHHAEEDNNHIQHDS